VNPETASEYPFGIELGLKQSVKQLSSYHSFTLITFFQVAGRDIGKNLLQAGILHSTTLSNNNNNSINKIIKRLLGQTALYFQIFFVTYNNKKENH